MVSAAKSVRGRAFNPALQPWGIMASTQSKSSSSGKNGARSISSSRLAAAKSSKAQKLSTPPKSKNSQSGAPAPISKAGSKPKLPSVPPATAKSGKNDARPAAGSVDAGTRSGVSKTELKAQFAKLSTATGQIGGLKRSLNKSFFDVGVLLNQIRNERLYEVKGYGSFESFVEREIGLNKALCMKIARVAEAIHRDEALAAGIERASAAVAALDGESEPSAGFRPVGSPLGAIPVHKL